MDFDTWFNDAFPTTNLDETERSVMVYIKEIARLAWRQGAIEGLSISAGNTFIGYRYFCPEGHYLFSRKQEERLELIGSIACEECGGTHYANDDLQEVEYA